MDGHRLKRFEKNLKQDIVTHTILYLKNFNNFKFYKFYKIKFYRYIYMGFFFKHKKRSYLM